MAIKMRNVTTSIKGIKSDDGFYAKFKNNGSEDIGVNGSSTPVTFTLEDLPADQKILLQSVSFLVGADENLDLGNFGDVNGPLANGVLFEAGDASAIIKDNGDIFLISSSQFTQTVGLLAPFTLISGRWDFTDTFGENGPMIMTADSLKITIRDNLSGISYFKVACHGILLEDN